jgi:hypothetical protein
MPLMQTTCAFLVVPAFSVVQTRSTSLPAAQLLEFVEPETGVKVTLIGAMHYNPSSVRLAKETIDRLGKANQLGSVIVEACDIRWNKTAELYADKPILKTLLSNEMRIACDTAMEFDRPVVLGDQRINITVDSLKAKLGATMTDLLTPPSGWKRFIDEVRSAWKETVPFGGQGYLSAYAFFDPRLLLVLPVSLIKYPLSYFVRDPIPTAIGVTLLGAISFLDDPTSLGALVSDDEYIPFSDWVLSFAIALLETAIFARLLLKPLLADRNEILAQSILDQCRLYANKPQRATSPINWFGFFSKEANVPKGTTSTSSIMYAPGSASVRLEDGPDKVVVAVLGMAHCNGIKRILTGSVTSPNQIKS